MLGLPESFLFAAIFGISLLSAILSVCREKRKKSRGLKKEAAALERIAEEIGAQLYASCPESKWRWLCRPAGFEIGGMGRIAVRYPCKTEIFVDVCISQRGYVELLVANVQRLSAKVLALPVVKGIKPIDEESTAEWYESVFIGTLTGLIADLTAKDDMCLCVCISRDGRVYTGEPGKCAAILQFESMPDVSLWEYIIEQLAEKNLLAEVWNEDHLFISWA